MSYTLLVIDMQSYFFAARHPPTRSNCKREIEKAIESDAVVLLVEYRGCGPTTKSLSDTLDVVEYKKWHVVKKSEDDGSKDIYHTLKAFKLPSKHLKVCGVNTDACVQYTVEGLAELLPKSKIEIISDACWTDGVHEEGIDSMREIKNVRIVGSRV